MLKQDSVILFQGDSITDVQRQKDNENPNIHRALGHGYPLMAAAELLAAYPEKNLQIYNRGIGGNKIWQLEERWKPDCLDLKPDLLSILIGVNDTWHGQKDPSLRVPLDRFEKIYRDLLDQAKEDNPKVRFVLCEPFIFDIGAVTNSWHPEIDQRAAIVRKVANDYNTIFIEFQSMFNKAAEKAPREYWLSDGVHPTTAGHRLMADAWVGKVNGI